MEKVSSALNLQTCSKYLPQMLITSPFPGYISSLYLVTNCDFFSLVPSPFSFSSSFFFLSCGIVHGPDPSALGWLNSHAQWPIKGYSSTVLDNLPGSSLICPNWLLFYSGCYLAPDPRLLPFTRSVWI